MKKLFLILLFAAAAAFAGFAQAQILGGGGIFGGGPYACTQWEQMGSSHNQSYKRKCQNARSSFDYYWEVCRPAFNRWDCRNAGRFEPNF